MFQELKLLLTGSELDKVTLRFYEHPHQAEVTRSSYRPKVCFHYLLVDQVSRILLCFLSAKSHGYLFLFEVISGTFKPEMSHDWKMTNCLITKSKMNSLSLCKWGWEFRHVRKINPSSFTLKCIPVFTNCITKACRNIFCAIDPCKLSEDVSVLEIFPYWINFG